MKKLRQILIFILVLCMMGSLCACQDKPVSSTEEGNGLSVIKGKYIVNKGTTEYQLVVPEKTGSLLGVTVSEFNKFFSEATGLEVSAITDAETQSGGKYISIGETSLLKQTGISYEYSELGNDGYKIVTKDENIYLIGGSDYGSLYAVYGLLEYLVDFDFFYEDCYTVRKNTSEIPLYDFQVTEVPDIEMRTTCDGTLSGNVYNLYRMRIRPYEETFIRVKDKNWAHNSFTFVTGDSRMNMNWFNNDKTQLCYTAHGIESEYKNMLDACFKNLKVALIENPDQSSVTFSIEDNTSVCNCDACLKVVEEYGALSASIVLFLNDLNELVRNWFETEEGSPYARDLKLVFFAYYGYEEAPVTYNKEKQRYEGNNGLAMDEGVYCMLCPLTMDYYRGIYHESNKAFLDTMEAWGDLADGKLYLWYYSVNFYYYLAPYDDFDSLQENYKCAVDNGTVYLFDERQYNEYGFCTGWSNLKSYLNYKLTWDVDQSVPKLLDQFFEGYFGPGAEDMRKYYDEFRILNNYNLDHNELGGQNNVFKDIVDEKYWPKDILISWIEHCDAAAEKLMSLEAEDPELYEMYLNNINGEKLAALYLFVECYSYNTSEDVLDAYKQEFKEIASELNVFQLSAHDSISVLYEGWGIN